MGDFLRYSMFDKYFKQIGCQNPYCPPGKDFESAHYLLSWYYSWGGSHPEDQGAWSWRIGASHAHFGYQHPLVAHVMSSERDFEPRTKSGPAMWRTSLTRQLEFYQWLQSAEGAIAGGATSSYQGRYGAYPMSQPTFYGMAYDPHPVFHDPLSNSWFGWQAWSVERLISYYAASGDSRVAPLLAKWVAWVGGNVRFPDSGVVEVPTTLVWEGAPDSWNPKAPGANLGLHVKVTEFGQDMGITAALARALSEYAAAKLKHEGVAAPEVAQLSRRMMDSVWTHGRDGQGLSLPEVRKDYERFGNEVPIPDTYRGVMASGAVVQAGSTFLSLRPQYTQDPDFAKVSDFLSGGKAPVFRYHRFWAEVEAALAYAALDGVL
jgi:hypothetical protein